ncbi:MAG: DUF2304 domain-containing protein [Polyangiaceae bacterium]|nr:DUF2304 domain-containing protein [Polyangiaceae bacterium]
MNVEITPAAIALVGLLAALLAYDITTLKNHRLLTLQIVVFGVGAALILCPEVARRLARAFGIGRGVDFVLYPLVIWLVRESLLTRRRRHEDEAKMTEIVRAMALANAHLVGGSSPNRTAPSQSDASASC